jgi:beta-phosphoglucomutase
LKFPEQIKKIKAVILDMDGVLVDTERLHMKSFELFLDNYGLKVDEEFLLSLIGTSIEDNIKMFVEHFPQLHGKNIQQMISDRNKIYMDLIRQEPLSPISGAIEVLDFCYNSNIKTALASSSDQEQIDLILNKLNSNKNFELNLYNVFHTIVAGDSVREKKPAPDIYKKAVTRLNIGKKHIIAIEDSQAGITSAKSAGIFCFALENSYNDVYRMNGPDYILKSLHDFVEFLFEL